MRLGVSVGAAVMTFWTGAGRLGGARSTAGVTVPVPVSAAWKKARWAALRWESTRGAATGFWKFVWIGPAMTPSNVV